MGIRKELMEKGARIETQEERIIVRKIRQSKEVWRIIETYVNNDINGKLQSIERWVKDGKREREVMTLVDFNARIGREGEGWKGEGGGGGREEKKFER